MPDDKKMLCLRFDDNNLELSYLLGLSILPPTIVLVYCMLKFLLQLLIHHPQNMSHPKKRETKIVTNEKSDAEDQLDEAKGQQAVVYRFRQRHKKIQREATSCSKLIAKEEESCVSKTPPRVHDGDLLHFSHRHPLLRFHLKGTEVIRCNMCAITISGVAYGCDCCLYFLHEHLNKFCYGFFGVSHRLLLVLAVYRPPNDVAPHVYSHAADY
ncbi:uncharacterized protein LOC107027352 isoform X2 [Solanum pennellii]|uniref:Uncharacterized protein LOC107027352 isoform X2 n=1 Tax=Solanum pennellii TaxID=28526 RepID=A0ABM1VHE9_SOLPN|nr:uncharacterized protein LOC107027352 isoform X2 [Solanum pennellii]